LLLQQLEPKITGSSNVFRIIEQHIIAHLENACGIHYDARRRRWIVAITRDTLTRVHIDEGNTVSDATARANGVFRLNAEIDRTINRVSELLGRSVENQIDLKTGELHLKFALDQDVVLGIQPPVK
jgi:hypothetical protein